MPVLFVVGGGLFGSLAAAYARSKGIEAVVFDPGLEGAASRAAAGLFKEGWVGQKLREHYDRALPLLDRLYGLRNVSLTGDDGNKEIYFCVPPTAILEPASIQERVTAVGDGWLEAAGRWYEGWVYIAAGVWCGQFLPGLRVYGKAGTSLVFHGEARGADTADNPRAPGHRLRTRSGLYTFQRWHRGARVHHGARSTDVGQSGGDGTDRQPHQSFLGSPALHSWRTDVPEDGGPHLAGDGRA